MTSFPVIEQHTRHENDLGFTIIATVYSHWVEFILYEIKGWDSSGAPHWNRKDADTWDPVDSLEESEPYLHGDVKWDGCSNWHFDEQDRVMLHGCGRHDLTKIGEVMGFCWDWTAELCPYWSQSVTGVAKRNPNEPRS